MKFHHVGIPTTAKREGEAYLASANLFVTDPTANPYGIEWLRFEPGTAMPIELQTRAHLAFEVDDLAAAMSGKTILVEPFEPTPGLKVGFIADDGAVIEFLQKTA